MYHLELHVQQQEKASKIAEVKGLIDRIKTFEDFSKVGNPSPPTPTPTPTPTSSLPLHITNVQNADCGFRQGQDACCKQG